MENSNSKSEKKAESRETNWVMYKAFLSDEKVGAVLSIYSDGKNFAVTPRSSRGLHSLLRFYEFLLLKVDMKTEYTVAPIKAKQETVR